MAVEILDDTVENKIGTEQKKLLIKKHGENIVHNQHTLETRNLQNLPHTHNVTKTQNKINEHLQHHKLRIELDHDLIS